MIAKTRNGRFEHLACVALALAACTPPEAAPIASVPAATATVSATETDEPLPPPSRWKGLSVARSTSSEPAPRGVLTVVVTNEGVSAGDARAPIVPMPADPSRGFDASYKRSGPNDLYLVPLADAVKDKGKEAVVAFAPEIPYRVVIEVLFTLGQSEISRFHMLVSRADGGFADASIEHEPPRMGASSLVGPAASMTVLLVKDGISVKTAGGNLAPGCSAMGPGLAIGAPDGRYDFGALTACAATIRGNTPGPGVVTLSANPNVSWQTVVSAIDAVRPSFSKVVFAVAR